MRFAVLGVSKGDPGRKENKGPQKITAAARGTERGKKREKRGWDNIDKNQKKKKTNNV